MFVFVCEGESFMVWGLWFRVKVYVVCRVTD